MDYMSFIFAHLEEKSPWAANGRMIGSINMGITTDVWEHVKQLSEEDRLVYESIMETGALPLGVLPPELVISSLNSLHIQGFLLVVVDDITRMVKGAFVKLPVQLFYYLQNSEYYEVDPESLLHSLN